MAIRRSRLVIAALAAALAVAVPAALAGSTAAARTAEGGSTDLWFVELSTSPQTFRANARAAGLSFTERFVFERLWKGLSVRIDPARVDALRQVNGVEAVYPVLTATFEPTVGESPELATAIAMTGADVAQSELGLDGSGVKVAVMDTGIDYNHRDLGGSGTDGDPASDDATFDGDFPNSRVVTGHDFVGDAFNASNPAKRTPSPDPDPDDCQGHGTHVAGIVGASPAADGGARGVAPGVSFGAYRVFGCTGSTTADIMLAAMERALDDGMHVLNMSIGSAFMTWPQYPTAAGSDALVDKGVVVVASIGNSGASGVYSAGAPGVGRKVIGVASFDNSHISALTFRVNPGDRQVPYLQISNTTTAPTSGTTPPVTYVGRGCNADPYLGDPKDEVALIDRGACTFNEKYQRAIDAGAVAVVIANSGSGLFAGGGVVDRGYPAVGISKEDGDAIKALLAGETATLTWTDERINAQNPNGGLASSFTSYGMTAELDLKPDIGAPGGLIRSTYPLEKGAYVILSGTSMSSPHVAGGVALFLEARPGTPAPLVRTILQNSADPIPWWASRSYLEVVHRQGAGMLDIDDAILSTTTVEPGKIALGEGTGGTATLTITNTGSSAVTYALDHQRALSTGGSTNSPRFFLWHQTASFSPSSITVPAGGSGTVDVTISGPERQGRQYGGYIRLTGDDGSVYRVPYAGFGGDYQAIQVLTDARCSLPGLFKRGGSSECDAGVSGINGFTRQLDGGTFTMEGSDVAYFFLHLEHQARRIELQLLDAESGDPIGGRRNSVFHTEDYLRRNSSATAFFGWIWDGTLRVPTRRGYVYAPQPDGDYKVKVSVLKALGDPANPAHWETWVSPTITIDRP